MRAGGVGVFDFLDGFDEASAKDARREREHADAQDGDDARAQLSHQGHGVHVAVAHRGQRCDGPPHGGRNAGERVGLRRVLAVVEQAG